MAKILGIIWILAGIIWLIRPDILKNRLKRKMSRRIRFTVYLFLIAFGILMVGSVMKAPGFFAKVVGIIGIVVAVKGTLLLLSKASDKLWTWWAGQPLMIFRIQALVMITVGIFLVRV